MALPVVANTRAEIGVVRDPNATRVLNVETLGSITDIGVPVATASDSYPRDLPSMPVSKTRKDKDGPVPFNPVTGNINLYQR